MISIACAIALYQLIFKPHYWEKTVHGLHLKKNFNKMIPEVTIQTIEKEETALFPNRFRANFINLFFDKKEGKSSIEILSCFVVSLSRTVTFLSSSESKSKVMQKGVPISSWL